MHLVDEQHVVRFERREDRGDITLALQRRAGDRVDTTVHLDRDDERKAGLAESGRSSEEHVITGFAATASSGNERLELTHCVLLPDEIAESLRAERAVDLAILRLFLAGDDAYVVRHQRPPPSLASAALIRSSAEPSAPCRAASASITE